MTNPSLRYIQKLAFRRLDEPKLDRRVMCSLLDKHENMRNTATGMTISECVG